MKEERRKDWPEKRGDSVVIPGIVIMDRGSAAGGNRPRIAAFIWGGKVRPTPTLPFGRWKGAA
jgi:hypothetical protein